MKVQAIICSFAEAFVDMRPFGAAVFMEFHHYLGPTFFRSARSDRPINPGAKCWAAYEKWSKTAEGKRALSRKV